MLKPGAHLLAFGGTRTWHRLAVAVEDAGFEIRDSIAWLYGSGFPKSLDVSKAIDRAAGAERTEGAREWQGGARSGGVMGAGEGTTTRIIHDAPATPDAAKWAGWGTALKPAFEPVVVGRKPLVGTVAGNVLAFGTGALNIDATRIGTEERVNGPGSTGPRVARGGGWREDAESRTVTGRHPANVVLDESQAAELDRQSGVTRSTAGGFSSTGAANSWDRQDGGMFDAGRRVPRTGHDDSGGASRFFYVAKAGKSERPVVDGEAHATVKPLALMQYLVRLVTPPGGAVLEPFAGSGTTVEACLREGFSCIAIEREASYLPLIMHRVRKDHAQSLFDLGDN